MIFTYCAYANNKNTIYCNKLYQIIIEKTFMHITLYLKTLKKNILVYFLERIAGFL